jgi:uncharacterized membrane protein YphA (DoxX/SURF4 family)
MDALKQWLTDPRVVRVCQVAIGVLFAVAALSKLGDVKSFSAEVHNFRIVPIATENLVAITLPWIELVAAVALIVGIRARAGGLLVTAMLVAFTVGIIAAMIRGLDIECGCFGTADAQHVGVLKVLENLGMLALAAVASLRPR